MKTPQVILPRNFLKNIDQKIFFIGLFVFSLMFFAQNLNIHGLEYRDDEIFYFKSTQEMEAQKKYLSPTYFGEDRFQKPILFYWLILLSYKVFGISWFAARFPSALSASFIVCLTFWMGSKLFHKKIGLLSSFILMTLPLFFRHAKNAVPDMTLTLFIVLGICCVMKFIEDPKDKLSRYGFFVFCALGFMIKGFAALVIPFLTLIVYCSVIKRFDLLKRINFPGGILVFLVIVLPWFLYMAQIHGERYADYMLKTETLNRMVSVDVQQNAFLKLVQTFKNNSLFYVRTILSYFAPWSIFIFGMIPVVAKHIMIKKEGREPLLLISVWFLSGFLFFSMIFARINHLILVITTPFAILLGYFLLHPFCLEKRAGRMLHGLRKFCMIFIMTFGLLGICFLRVLVPEVNGVWLMATLLIWLVALIFIKRDKRPFLAPFVFAVVMLFIYGQSNLLSASRLLSHACLQSFAETIREDLKEGDLIGVASHDIHEKEFQAYFDHRVEKVATSDPVQSRSMISEFLGSSPKVFCLITKADFDQFSQEPWREKVRIVQEEDTFRRRMRIDQGLLKALLERDNVKIKDYFLERFVLIRKDENA